MTDLIKINMAIHWSYYFSRNVWKKTVDLPRIEAENTFLTIISDGKYPELKIGESYPFRMLRK